MRKELSDYQELSKLIKNRLARATSVAEVDGLRGTVEAFRLRLLKDGKADTRAWDDTRLGLRLCKTRRDELLKAEFNKLFG